mmetsp:Transcript_408/g.565  ORF Transcript_408/g.565 Transcript_408/m.565 type:complete len:104 (-) Transcript_408:61-372(-)
MLLRSTKAADKRKILLGLNRSLRKTWLHLRGDQSTHLFKGAKRNILKKPHQQVHLTTTAQFQRCKCLTKLMTAAACEFQSTMNGKQQPRKRLLLHFAFSFVET